MTKNNRICVVGLGIIGGSICKALKRAGLSVDGFDRDGDTLDYAITSGVIRNIARTFSEYKTVFVALPPAATAEFITGTKFGDGAVVADVCGVKAPVERAALAAERNFRYVGTHPMAGREASGIRNSSPTLFDGASIIITVNNKTDPDAYREIMRLAGLMGFGRAVRCSAKIHDKKIAYTSQLAHVVSNCYVNDPEITGCLGFTGGSFQDMTRIAGVDEDMWAALYLENAENLLEKVSNIRTSLDGFTRALSAAKAAGEPSAVRDFLQIGANIFRAGKESSFDGGEIEVIDL